MQHIVIMTINPPPSDNHYHNNVPPHCLATHFFVK